MSVYLLYTYCIFTREITIYNKEKPEPHIYHTGILVEDIKTSISPVELLKSTIVDILHVNNASFQEDVVVYADGKTGFDGSGAHPTRNQEEATKESGKNYLASFWSPLRIKVWHKDFSKDNHYTALVKIITKIVVRHLYIAGTMCNVNGNDW